MTRKESLIALRPEINSIRTMDYMTDIEKFQNEVIRPILKYQHKMIIQYTLTKAIERNSKFETLIAIDKERYLDKVTLKDSKVKQELTGMILGLMTVEEINIYLVQESEYKRRINTMIRERIVSTF